MASLLAEDVENRASQGDVDAQLLLARRCQTEGAREKAGEWLRRAAASGTADAKAALGRHLQIGRAHV